MKKGIDQTTILSKDKTIDQAKIILDWTRQKDTIASLQDKIDKLKEIVEKQSKTQERSLNEISSLNEFIRGLVKEENDVSDDMLDKEKFKWKGFHFRLFTEIDEFDFNQIKFGGRLNYEMNKFDLSLIGNTDNIGFTYSGVISYKIF